MYWKVRGKAIKIAFCVAALWLCTSWTTPGLLLATVTDSLPGWIEVVDTGIATPSTIKRPRAREAQAAGAQRDGGAAGAGDGLTEATQLPPPQLRDLAACIQETAPATPACMDDVIAGKAPQ